MERESDDFEEWEREGKREERESLMVAGEISVTHYSCERRDYAFIVLRSI